MRRSGETESTPITIEIGGKQYGGFYRVAKGVVTVTTAEGRKSTQVGGSTAEIVARMLLRELISEGRA